MWRDALVPRWEVLGPCNPLHGAVETNEKRDMEAFMQRK